MTKLTIFTPTYNRAHTLPRLFDSLVNQTNYEFEWLIVDDGSTDDTEEIVKTFITEKFPIRYIKQKNGGKHIATNIGLKCAYGELFTCLDSDDWFYPEAVAFFIDQFAENNEMNALISLDTFENGEIVGEKLPKIDNVNWVDLRYKYQIKGDKCYVFKTKIVKNMTFPQYGESIHMPPSYQLFDYSRYYNFHLSNEKTKFVEYQNDGISSKVKQNYFKSAENYCEYRKFANDQLPNLKEKIKNILLFDISWIELKLNSKFKFKSKSAFILSILCLPISYVMYIYYKNYFREK
ncbi:glycosyltransferase family 2 protein [Staphylococcus lloydii]|uniref:glycosyltransferase family 2 protein n=1 Tax=Staphylococcus TaxID=1279 RepID=UPI00292789F5|nr:MULTISPECIES: glycosyltransferase family 2 protein [Staphylococcus]MDU9418805.1 glycosyltransferase family 2 protein [Staphylococcus lloydii]MEB7800881.1 glycosyltransferase family 2 protein [Staphylococcus xylosus]